MGAIGARIPFLTLLVITLAKLSTGNDGRKNVLFIVVDDLRADIGAFKGSNLPYLSVDNVHTPNMDALAEESAVFEKNYASVALCGPSRTAFLTSRRPGTTRAYDNVHHFRATSGNPDMVTLPEHFKRSGYRTFDIGKVFNNNERTEDPQSWTELSFKGYDYYKEHWNNLIQPVGPAQEKWQPTIDQQLADHAIEALRELSETGDRFFMGLGFREPHSPYTFPEKYLKLYPLDEIHPPSAPHAPAGMPAVAWHDYSNSLGAFSDVHKNDATGELGRINFTFPDNFALEARRGYYASVSHVDHQLGRVLRELERLGMAGDTIVSFIGDHGYHLGEQSEWEKNTNFEAGLHCPMMIKIPGQTTGGSLRIDRFTELVDLAPSLVRAAGLPRMPPCPEERSAEVDFCTEGSDLMELLGDPNGAKWKNAVFSQHHRPVDDAFMEGDPDTYTEFKRMGFTVRTWRFRYTEWPKYDFRHTHQADWSGEVFPELYDLGLDPDSTVNLAGVEEYSEIQLELRQMLRSGWRAELN